MARFVLAALMLTLCILNASAQFDIRPSNCYDCKPLQWESANDVVDVRWHALAHHRPGLSQWIGQSRPLECLSRQYILMLTIGSGTAVAGIRVLR